MEFERRKSFQRRFALVTEHKVRMVIIENKDGLVRLGFDLYSMKSYSNRRRLHAEKALKTEETEQE